MNRFAGLVPSDWRLVEVRPGGGEPVVVPPDLGASASFVSAPDVDGDRDWFEWTDGVSSYASRYVISDSSLIIKDCVCTPNAPVDPDPVQRHVAELMSIVLVPPRGDGSGIEVRLGGDILWMRRIGHTLVLRREAHLGE